MTRGGTWRLSLFCKRRSRSGERPCARSGSAVPPRLPKGDGWLSATTRQNELHDHVSAAGSFRKLFVVWTLNSEVEAKDAFGLIYRLE
ncbi:MAG: hypothetical protein JWP15_3847 [Alphaproteobacteria bacterium]|nr:hypothetical protein [Alphaproteobacteria bacterium]